MFDDLVRHPGFALLAFGALAVAVIWMIYTMYRDNEREDLDYAQLDLLWQILEKVR